jgi:hypothetical protein
VKVNRSFRGTGRFNLLDARVIYARNQQEANKMKSIDVSEERATSIFMFEK